MTRSRAATATMIKMEKSLTKTRKNKADSFILEHLMYFKRQSNHFTAIAVRRYPEQLSIFIIGWVRFFKTWY